MAGGFGALLIPHFDVAVAAAADETAVVGEVEGLDAAAMSGPFFHFFSFIHFPESDGAIFAGGREDVAIGAPCDGGDGGGMAGQSEIFIAAFPFPDVQAAGSVAGGEQDAIGAELK